VGSAPKPSEALSMMVKLDVRMVQAAKVNRPAAAGLHLEQR